MFSIVILIGIYSYLIFALGLLGLLYRQNVVVFSISYTLAIFLAYRYKIIYCLKQIRTIKIPKISLTFILSALIVLLALVNLIGALGPELGFDALWYHLTFPKIYLDKHIITHIPGGLLYYSDMPKLTEMIYIGALSFGNEILAKLVHFSFGILSLVALYKLSRNFFNQTYSVVTILIFYSNLVVAWQSTTAYIDLVRTFFEIMALWGFLNWWKKGDRKWLIESAVMIGLSISVKLLAVESLFMFSILVGLYSYKYKKSIKYFLINISSYWFMALLIPLPWFIFSFIHTGNPIYPFFSAVYNVGLNFRFINPFIHKSDSISVIYILIPALLPFIFRKLNREIKVIFLYSFLGFIAWYLTPKTDGGRFMLPYLPAFSLILVSTLVLLKHNLFKKIIICFIILASIVSIVYRGAADYKYLPVILNKESKSDFLAKHLNFSYGDFYDTDSYFMKNMTKNDMVLLYGFHNLYYVDFPFIDSSWVKKGDIFNYIAVQNSIIPKRFSYWNLVYYNKKTNVKLYSLGGQKWAY